MHAVSKSYLGWEMLTCGGEGRTGHGQGAVCKLLHCSEGLGAGRQHDSVSLLCFKSRPQGGEIGTRFRIRHGRMVSCQSTKFKSLLTNDRISTGCPFSVYGLYFSSVFETRQCVPLHVSHLSFSTLFLAIF